MHVVVPEKASVITPEQMENLNKAVKFIKEKLYGKIKVRTWADSSTQTK